MGFRLDCWVAKWMCWRLNSYLGFGGLPWRLNGRLGIGSEIELRCPSSGVLLLKMDTMAADISIC